MNPHQIDQDLTTAFSLLPPNEPLHANFFIYRDVGVVDESKLAAATEYMRFMDPSNSPDPKFTTPTSRPLKSN